MSSSPLVRPLSILGQSWLWKPSYLSEMAGPTRTHGRSPRRRQDPAVRPWQLPWTWPGWVWTTPWKMSPPVGKSDTGQMRLSVWNRPHPHRRRKSYPSRSIPAIGLPWSQQETHPRAEIKMMMMFLTETWNEWRFLENHQSPSIFWQVNVNFWLETLWCHCPCTVKVNNLTVFYVPEW